jgi:23S rRNA (cytidine1920-2'-O)/16S rRNA (cytidine1409-2'-O)-methyltransferase
MYLPSVARRRVDTLLAERGLSPSRTSAAASVRAGRVRVGSGGARATKPGQLVAPDTELILEEPPPYVSRGGIKLENAMAALGVDPGGRDCLDVGASTGGFTDCLLRHGAARVIALDVARGELDWGLRNDPRVHVIERANARYLGPDDLPWTPSLATVDVSFISLRKVLAPVAACLAPGGDLLALVKPQFELGRDRVGKGGVVRDPDARREALEAVARAAVRGGLAVRGFAPSGLPGPKGNRETFVWLERGDAGLADLDAALAEVDV